MKPRFAISTEDFKEMRDERLEYVDKSHLIQELLDRPGDKVVLLPRPRRFGKTLNMSMLRYFFEKSEQDRSPLFKDLSIWRAGEEYRAHLQRYPVIFVTLKDIARDHWRDTFVALRARMQEIYRYHDALLDSPRLRRYEKLAFEAILTDTAEDSVYPLALKNLCSYLWRHHGEPVFLLIDEYDAPLHKAFLTGHLREAVSFFQPFFGATLKSNPALKRAVLTGILRIAKENIFSELNNVGVYTCLRPEFSTCFGFTEPEVQRLLERAGTADLLNEVRGHYNGYAFGGDRPVAIYNPWSINNFLASADHRLRNFWVNTSANALVHELLRLYAFTLHDDIQALLNGGSIVQPLEENVVLEQVRQMPQAFWSLLVFTGYLKAEDTRPAGSTQVGPYRLSIPNREVYEVFQGTFKDWLEGDLLSRGATVEHLIRALLAGDTGRLEKYLQGLVTDLLSYHDVPRPDLEAVYHIFTLGLLAVMEGPAALAWGSALRRSPYRVRSNRESGTGRPDVLVIPTQPGEPGVVLEFKQIAEGEDPESALAAGIEQISGKEYAAELRAAGATPIHGYAVVCDGKRLRVRSASL